MSEVPKNMDMEMETATESGDQIDELITVIEGLSDLTDAYSLRDELAKKQIIGMRKKEGNKKGKKEMVARDDVEGSDRIVAALKTQLKRLHTARGRERAENEKMIGNLIADIEKQDTTYKLSVLAKKAHDKGYVIKRYVGEGERDWVVEEVTEKPGSNKIVTAFMKQKAEIEAAEDEAEAVAVEKRRQEVSTSLGDVIGKYGKGGKAA